ncbi:Long-chain-fatty-acid--CoA ligase 1-like, partial [Scleropages formosus]
VADRAELLGSALLHRGHSQAGDKFIGIFSQNRPEVTSISTVLCDVAEKARLILDCVATKEHTVRTLVLMEPFDAELVARGRKCGIEILSLKELEPPKPDDLALICFTSGTTGNPKGAMLTHRNVVSNCSAFIKITERMFQLNPDDVLISFLPLAHMFEQVVEMYCMLKPSDIHVSYLPLAHMFERVVQEVVLCHGARIGFFQGDIRLLMDDLKMLRPTVFPVRFRCVGGGRVKRPAGLPLQIFGQANTPLKRWLLDFASRRKEADLRSGVLRKDSMWDRLIFSKVQASLGGRVRLMITGAAPVSPTVLTFLRAALGCQVGGRLGFEAEGGLVKLVDVADMNYYAINGEGEVCVKGPNVFQGYLKDPEKTAEAMDKDGWLHTGDIGKWLPNGTLKIVDRKKHIFKLAQGEYIAPEKIENIYIRSDPVAQAFIHGDSLQACLVGIIVPDPEILPSWSKRRGLEGSYAELCRSKELKDAILEDILRLGKEAGLKSFEQVKDIALHAEMFSVQNGLLTPTMKAKRADLRSHFREQIDELYAKIKM